MVSDKQQHEIDMALGGAAEAEADYAANAEAEMALTEGQLTLGAVNIMALELFANEELAAANLAIHGFERIIQGNLAYDRALKAGLIKPDGSTWDVKALQAACVYEVNRRVQAGTFN